MVVNTLSNKRERIFSLAEYNYFNYLRDIYRLACKAEQVITAAQRFLVQHGYYILSGAAYAGTPISDEDFDDCIRAREQHLISVKQHAILLHTSLQLLIQGDYAKVKVSSQKTLTL